MGARKESEKKIGYMKKDKERILFRHFVTFKDGELDSENPKCGEIWLCDLGKNDGSIQSGYRPVFVISNNKNNLFSTTINVFPLTSKMNKNNLPVHVEIKNYEKFGLKVPSTIIVEQPMTVENYKFSKYIGRIDDADVLNDIYKAMEIQFPILSITG